MDSERKISDNLSRLTNRWFFSKIKVRMITYLRYKIEGCFRIMKTNFSGRPALHWTEPRIKAHFLICYTALLVYRLLECKLDEQGTHITTANLIKTLQNMNVVNVHDVEYMAIYKGNKTLDALTKLSELELDRVH